MQSSTVYTGEGSGYTDLNWGPREKYKLLLTKNCKESEILLYLPSNKLACLSFMDIGRSYETDGQERKDFITAINSMNHYYWY